MNSDGVRGAPVTRIDARASKGASSTVKVQMSDNLSGQWLRLAGLYSLALYLRQETRTGSE